MSRIVWSSALPPEPELADLPLFFNPEPGAVERLASEAIDWDPGRAAQVPGAERLVTLEVEEAVQLDPL